MSKTGSQVKPQLTLNTKDNIHDIFEYKKAYEIHVRKLSQIRNMRKSSLKANSIRNNEIEYIKDVKHNNFVYKMNQEANKICGDNLRLFDKLNREMNATREKEKKITIKMPLSMKAKRSIDLTASYNRLQRQKLLGKQNQMLRQRIKSSEPYINRSRMLFDQKHRQQIKSRIRKFNANSQLKVHRYLSAMSSRSNKDTSFSCNLSNHRRNSCSDVNSGSQVVGRTKKQRKDGKMSSFYNPKNVIMNKIENFGVKYNKFKRKQGRPATTSQFQNRAPPADFIANQSNCVFQTQPLL